MSQRPTISGTKFIPGTTFALIVFTASVICAQTSPNRSTGSPQPARDKAILVASKTTFSMDDNLVLRSLERVRTAVVKMAHERNA
jgi:hypothetical protein